MTDRDPLQTYSADPSPPGPAEAAAAEAAAAMEARRAAAEETNAWMRAVLSRPDRESVTDGLGR